MHNHPNPWLCLQKHNDDYVASNILEEARQNQQSIKGSAEPDRAMSQSSDAERALGLEEPSAASSQGQGLSAADRERSESSFASISSSQNAATEDASGGKNSQDALLKSTDAVLASEPIQDTAYREHGQNDSRPEEQDEQAESKASGNASTSAQKPEESSSSDKEAELAAVKSPDPEKKEEAGSKPAHVDVEAEQAQDGEDRDEEAALKQEVDSQEDSGVKRDSDQKMQEESDGKSPELEEEIHMQGSLQPQAKPAQEQDSVQAEDSVADAASVSSLDLGEGTHCLEETSDAESHATGTEPQHAHLMKQNRGNGTCRSCMLLINNAQGYDSPEALMLMHGMSNNINAVAYM